MGVLHGAIEEDVISAFEGTEEGSINDDLCVIGGDDFDDDFSDKFE